MPEAASQAPLLQAQGLVRHYAVSRGWLAPKAVVRALDGISFTLESGRTLAVVGESGCGKSTLARLVTMIERPTAGTLTLGGVELATAGPRERRALRPQVSMVFQNPYAQLNPRKTIAALLAEPLAINTTLAAGERRDAALAMMARVGLRPDQAGRYPHMFSGGQRQRIAIARALMLSPRLVVADEPVSALDVSVQAQVLNLLMDLQRDTAVAYLFISHNLHVVRHIAERILVMYLGRVVESGARDRIFARPAHPYTRALLAATPRLDAARPGPGSIVRGELPSPLAPPRGCAFHARCPHAVERCRAEPPALQPLDDQQVACHLALELNR
ncbi:MAG TPA: dipeptide ABC transporter ATP-binding protein [Burkholderiaceae bacterium]|nr:dipeptide ABC transporter ATP-binding protein [Burkholderiaceae bacterium]